MSAWRGLAALVTGGGSGIGLGLATALGKKGARIAIAGTNADRLDAAADALRSLGIEALAVPLDVSVAEQWPAARDRVEAALGPIRFLALNAGVAPPPATIAQTSPEVWRWSLGVNLWGVINGLSACLPSMQARRLPSHIMMTASIAALAPQATMGAYVAAKAGVVGLAEVLRAELAGTPLGCSVMAPAAVRTNIVDTSRRHTPVDNDSGYAHIATMLANGLDPLRVASHALERAEAGDFYLLSHGQFRPALAERFSALEAAMRHSIEAPSGLPPA